MKLRPTILLFLSLLLVGKVLGQTYGNEWINYGQKYYSLKISTTGIHKLEYSTLFDGGVPLGTFSTENIQIFGKEQEIPLYIVDGNDNQLDPGDYILFYAEKNDGWLDATLYNSPEDVGNPKYSLYNDTIQYFFTWNSLSSNLRYVEETDVNFTAYTPSNYVLFEKYASNNNSYNEGEKSSGASSSFYTSGEGWGSTPKNGVAGELLPDYSSTPIEQVYFGADSPLVKYKAVSVGLSNDINSVFDHHTRHTIGSSNYVISDTLFSGYKAVHINKTFPTSVLPASGPSNLKISFAPLAVATDYQSLNYWSIIYPRLPNLSGATQSVFSIQNNTSQSKIRLDLAGVTPVNPIVFALGDVPRKLSLASNGLNYSFLLPNSTNGVDQQIIYQESSTFINVVDVNPVGELENGLFKDFANIGDLEEALLMVYNPNLKVASIQYADYRSLQYNVILANVDELYQQYGGGIPKHINGIRRFSHHIYNLATEKPVGLFLMGKGIREANVVSTTSTGPGSRTNPSIYAQSLIPSFGQPSSDACITSNLPECPNKWTPLIPTGRIAAQTNQELVDYLEKVQMYEANQDQDAIYNSETKDWQKQVLHFVGGANSSEHSLFMSYMNPMVNIIENEFFGGNVATVEQTSGDPLDPAFLNDVMSRIDNGVSLITFFGHALPTNSGFEINIDEPINWNNTGKFPIVLTNSCYNGNIFQTGLSTSEKFVNAPESGAIAYIGTVNLGFANTLAQYSSELYRQFSGAEYGSTLGSQMRSSIEANYNPSDPTIFTSVLRLESTCTQMALNGDPMLKLNWHEKPEIELREERVSFSPELLDLTTDSIEMNIELVNLGHSIIDSFLVEVTRNFPSSSVDSVYQFYVPELHYKYNLTFKLPLQPNIALGINQFSVKVDLPTNVDEIYDEINNNQIVKTLFINVDGIQPVLPYEYAVVPDDSVTLIASTINPVADFNIYRFEIDTIDFEGAPSPFHRYAIVSGLGGLKEVNPSQWILSSSMSSAPLNCTNKTSYFWRVAVDEPSPIWRESSFQYIQDKIGWGQDHFYQFKNNGFYNVDYDRPSRKRLFGPTSCTLTCDVFSSASVPAIHNNAYYICGNQEEYGICTLEPSLYVAVIDPLTFEPWGTHFGTANPENSFNNANDLGACRGRVEDYFIFRHSSASQLAGFQSMMAAVPDSHFILVYSPMSTSYDQWDILAPSMYSTFQGLGSDSIVPGRPNLPFAFFCRKGDVNSVVELFAQNPGEDVHLEAELQGYDYSGQEFSTMIGPASEWTSLLWKQDSLENPNTDSTNLFIRAFDINMALQNVIQIPFTSNDSIQNLGALVDASLYPYLQLGAYYEDTFNFTPAQIDRWHVYYTPLPEAAIDGSTAYTWLPASDTLAEGQEVQFAVDVKNIYTIPMDSLLISYWIQDSDQIKHPIAYSRQDSLLVGETFRDTISFTTLGLAGINSFWMEVNPYVNGSLYITDQPEQQHFNNLLQLPFYVNGDDQHPILDVTFNGRHILNGDIISPESDILISLKDDNPLLIMNDISDTTLFGVYLTDPDGIQTRIPFTDAQGNTIMQWIPADAQNMKFKIMYPGNFEKDGNYTLFVQGSDRSGNVSGDLEYRITFEVIHESTISFMMNYPNPFSTSTRFVFTLTGSEVPDEIIIQIMTVSGKVVREITEDQLGAIQIGRNISEYEWNGTDEFGDPLANGVYLYTVRAQINGEDIKHMESGADQHFKKEYGKMYILR